MRKIIYILILAFILYSCQNEKKLNGTWISAYKYDETDSLKVPITGPPFNQIWRFNDGTLNIKEFKYDWYEEEKSFKFQLKGNKLVVNDNEPYFSELIQLISKDSFQLSRPSYSGFKMIYKKLNDSLKNQSSDFKLTGNRYKRHFKKWTDTIYFVNDSVFKSSGWTQGDSNLMWERVNYNGFDILFTDIYPPFILKSKNGNTVQISTFDTEKEDYIMSQIE